MFTSRASAPRRPVVVLAAACRRLCLLGTLCVLAAGATAQPAMGTTLTGETLTGSGPSTGGGAGTCTPTFSPGGNASFSVSGSTGGPYPGSFTETGTFSLSGSRNPPWTIGFSANFTITSGANTISGGFAAPAHAAFTVGFICDSAGRVTGYTARGNLTYHALVNGTSLIGTATVSGTFYTTAGVTDSLSQSITVTYGQISGLVTARATQAPLAGICVKAYNTSGAVLASTVTGGTGTYTLRVPSGTAFAGFFSGCGATNYISQYYNGQPSLSRATAISVPAGGTDTGIDAAMVTGAEITGTVTDSVSHAGVGGICIQAYNFSGVNVASTQTDSAGAYTLSALPTAYYRVGFIDCATGNYVAQYYNDQPSLAGATQIVATAGTVVPGINAVMVPEGRITGTVTDSATGAPLAGICVDTYDGTGTIISSVPTDTTGVYLTPRYPAGTYRVGFFDCGASTYAAQFWKDQTTLAAANPVTVANGLTTSGINAAMVAG